MKNGFLILLVSLSTQLWSQETTNNRNGWIFGTAVGASVLHLSTSGLPTEIAPSISFPNFKIGKMITKRTAILLYLPGSIYTYKGVGRQRDRGFEGIIPAAQYWVTPRWWVLGGVGLTLDAPAFYDIKGEDEHKFYFGPSVLAATGYELWRKGNFALDLQVRMHYGYSIIPEGKRTGMAGTTLVGFNWYFHNHE